MTLLLRTATSFGRDTAAKLVLGIIAFGTISAVASMARADDADLVKRGEYLATAGDCVACHTAPGGKPYSGGLYLKTPIGGISTPNLTPDKETGLGNWTDDQFYKAFHDGIGNEGEYLYPAFPFPWYTKVTKEDALAIKAYLFSLKPVHAPRKELKIGFPFDVRTGLITWRTAFFKAETFKPDPKASETVNRGAYLVEGLGHCGECHNTDKLVGTSSLSGKLQGGVIDGYYAPNITDGKQGVGSWSKDDIVSYLKSGAKPDHTSVAQGPMKQVVTDSTSKMTDADLGAIADYLKSVAGKETISADESSKGAPKSVAAADAYMSYCVSCHQTDGKGIKNAIPALAGNGAVTAKGPENVIRAVLGGIPASNGLGPMPAFGQTMSDEEIAQAVNYVRSNWGNHAPADVGGGAVAALRKDSETMLAMNRPDGCMSVTSAAKPNAKLPAAIDNDEIKGKLDKMSTEDMLSTIDDILPSIKKGAPEATTDQITNALTAAYCPIAMEKAKGGDRAITIGNFAGLVYGQAKKDGKPN